MFFDCSRYALSLTLAVLLWAGCGVVGSRSAQSPRFGLPKAAPGAARCDAGEAELEQRARAHAHYAAGVVYELNGETELALEAFSQAAIRDPGNETLVLEVAGRLLAQKQPEKAVRLLTNTLAHAAGSGGVYAQLGAAYAELGKLDLAIEANRAAVKKAPAALAGYQNLVAVYLQAKRPGEAFKVLEEAFKHAGADAGFLISLAELYFNYGREVPTKRKLANAQALEALHRAAKLNPTAFAVRLKLADGFNLLGQTGKAAAVYRDLLAQYDKLAPLRNAIRTKLADLYLRIGDRKNAREQLEALVRDEPTHARAYFLLGTLAFEEKQIQQAADHFTKTVLLSPNFEQPYYELARAQIYLNQTREALATLEKARAKFPDNFVLQFLTGLAYGRDKDYVAAIRNFTAAELIAQTTDPGRLTAGFYFQLGSAYERVGNIALAAQYLEKSIALAPDFAEALNYLGYMWAERGMHLERARELIERAVKAEPDNPAFLDSLGWVLFKLNQPQLALEHLLRAAAAAQPPDATIYDHLGDVYAALNEMTKAREAWQKSLELESNEAVRKKLEQPSDPPE